MIWCYVVSPGGPGGILVPGIDHRWREITTLDCPEEITQVNRQIRLETLPIVYETPREFNIRTDRPEEWVEDVEDLIDQFSDKSGSPGFGMLHHVSTLRMLLEAVDPDPSSDRWLKIWVWLMNDREEMIRKSEEETEDAKIGYVVIGKPGFDWTDAKAVRAECDKAATWLARKRTRFFAEAERARREEPRETFHLLNPERTPRDHLPYSDTDPFRAALDVICTMISSCPRLTNVAILDVESDE